MSDYAVILCARMSSERLPGKALVSYCPDGTPNLTQIIRRWRASKRQPTIIVATTNEAIDNPIAALCDSLRVPCFRGSRENVLERMNGAIEMFSGDAKYVARAMADNPLVDVALADWRLDILADCGTEGIVYSGDKARMTYCATTDVWSRAGWEKIVAGSKGDELEHAGNYYWRNLDKFNYSTVPLARREYVTPIRTELDKPEDLEMFKQLWNTAHLTGHDCIESLRALEVLWEHPEIAAINAGVEVKTMSPMEYGSREKPFLCDDCRNRMAGITEGNLVLKCTRCGKRKKFYAIAPKRKPSMSHY